MFCVNCGKELKEGAVFCTNCGTRVAPPETTSAQQPTVNAEPVTPPETPPAQQPTVNAASVTPPETAPAAAVPPLSIPPDEPNSGKKGKKGKGGLIALIALLILVLLGLLGVAAYMLIEGGFGGNAGKVAELMAEAEDYEEAGKYKSAVKCYLEVLEDLDSNNEDAADALTDAYIAWAESLADDGDYEGAVNVLEQASELADSKSIEKAITAIEKERKKHEEQAGADAESTVPEEPATEVTGGNEDPSASEILGGASSLGLPGTVGAVPAEADAVLREYYENNVASEEVDKSVTYRTSYRVPDEYAGAAPEDAVAYPEYVEGVNGSVLAHDIRDWDQDGQAEMLVIGLDQTGSNEYGQRCSAYYAEMYEVADGSVYLADRQYMINDVLGGCDMEYQSFLIKDDGNQVYLALEDMYLQTLFADNYGYMAVDLFCYEENYGFREIYGNSVRGRESDLQGDETFAEAAEALRYYGFSATAEMINDGTYGTFEFDEDGDDMEVLVELLGIAEIVMDTDAFTETGQLASWLSDGDPAGLGYVLYNFR